MLVNLFLGIFVAIYIFSTRWVKNDPLKSQIDSSVSYINGYLILMNNYSSHDLLDKLSNFSSKLIVAVLIISSLLLFILPFRVLDFSLPFLSGIFVVSIFLNLSIEWKHNHRKTVREFFFKNIGGLSILFAPIIIFIFYHLTDGILFSELKNSFQAIFPISNIWLAQILWFMVAFISIYFLFWVITYPIYLLLKISIITVSFIIKIFHNYINTNILDGLVGLIILCIAISKVV